MTDYKLVPFEPTAEMMKAFCVASKAATTEEWEDPLHADKVAHVLKTMPPVYRAMLAATPAVQVEPVGWVWHSYNQTNFTSGSHHKEVLEADGVKLTPVYTAPQSAEQKPAPDVAELVEALRRIADLPIGPCSTENDYRLSAAKAIAAGVLAAHRKQPEGEA